MSVGEICERRVVTAQPGEMIRTVAQRMDQEDVGCVVVVDSKRGPLGIVTDRDIAIRVLRRHLSPDETAVRQVMSEDLLTVRDTSSILLALGRMRADGFRRAPVIDPEGHLVGVFAVDDALAHIARDVSAASQVVGAQRGLVAS